MFHPGEKLALDNQLAILRRGLFQKKDVISKEQKMTFFLISETKPKPVK